ncbi:Detected protein of confused Function [Hibiscus syriacus]|uniref:Detected protein of confused Function n=1 Tax=Hibiscus syriacus TaxID=106335 RepID=A0A6A3AND3_HIBSY|nr:Detected protein of confused Function [Hibiscus syriacus]
MWHCYGTLVSYQVLDTSPTWVKEPILQARSRSRDDESGLGRKPSMKSSLMWADYYIALAAIARRRKLLSDDAIISLADSSWEILDLSAMQKNYCRWCIRTRAALSFVGEFEMRELYTMVIGHGAQSIRWLVWVWTSSYCVPSIPLNLCGTEVPREAFPDVALDDPIVKDIDPKTWSVYQSTAKAISQTLPSANELSIAEKFRLAFVERHTVSSETCKKNARQHQRRLEREWVMMSTRAKALALASEATKSLNGRS